MPMLNPPHPGPSVKHDCLESLRLTVTKAAEILGVTRQTLNDLVPLPARDLTRNGNSARHGVRRGAGTSVRPQAAHDLAQARKTAKIDCEHYVAG